MRREIIATKEIVLEILSLFLETSIRRRYEVATYMLFKS